MKIAFIPLFVVFFMAAKPATKPSTKPAEPCKTELGKTELAEASRAVTKKVKTPSQRDVAVALTSIVHLANLEFLSAPKNEYAPFDDSVLRSVKPSHWMKTKKDGHTTHTFILMSSNFGTSFLMNPRIKASVQFSPRSAAKSKKSSESDLPVAVTVKPGTLLPKYKWDANDRITAGRFVAEQIMKALKTDRTDPLSRATSVGAVPNIDNIPKGHRAFSFELREGSRPLGKMQLIYAILENGSPRLRDILLTRYEPTTPRESAGRPVRTEDEILTAGLFLLNETAIEGPKYRRADYTKLVNYDAVTNLTRLDRAIDREIHILDRKLFRQAKDLKVESMVVYPHWEETPTFNANAMITSTPKTTRIEMSYPRIKPNQRMNVSPEKLESIFWHMAQHAKGTLNGGFGERLGSVTLVEPSRDTDQRTFRRFPIYDPYDSRIKLAEIRLDLNYDPQTFELLYPPVKAITVTVNH